MLRFLHAASGDITSSDLDLADASDGIIIGFNIDIPEAVAAEGKQRGTDMRTYRLLQFFLHLKTLKRSPLKTLMQGELLFWDPELLNLPSVVGQSFCTTVFVVAKSRSSSSWESNEPSIFR
jgi:hypothetical protein